jgi:hypothetical protein
MTYEEVCDVALALPLEDQIRLKSFLSFEIQGAFLRAEQARQDECLHLRAKEHEWSRGSVTWICPDCWKSEKRDAHHGGAME